MNSVTCSVMIIVLNFTGCWKNSCRIGKSENTSWNWRWSDRLEQVSQYFGESSMNSVSTADILKATVMALLGSIIPALLSGAVVGVFFPHSFWYWTLGIAALAGVYIILDRVPLRLYLGVLRGFPLWPLLKYGYAAPELRPTMSAAEYEWYMNWIIYNTPFRLFRDRRRKKDSSSFHHW